MTGKVEYLERYSVAPSPSRDYYGLKILRDEVILYIWKISHGPHKTPIVRRSKFFEFDRDKALQDDISRIFGDHFVSYVRTIARGKGNTLLTLPRSSLRRIVGYLQLEDIVNLSTLSRVANLVFNDNFVWEALYRRHERFKIGREEREYAMAYGWKQAFKEKQTALSAGRRKTPSSAKKVGEKLKMQQGSTRPVSGPLKVVSKASTSSMNAETSRSMQIAQKTVTTNLIRSFKDSGIDGAVKSIQVDKKIIKKPAGNSKICSTQNPKNLENGESNVQMVESKHNIREAFSDSMTAARKSAGTQRGKLRKASVSAKSGTTNVKVSDKGKSGDTKRNASGKSNLSLIKSNAEVPVGKQDQIKSRSKSKNKTKKVTQAKSTILNVDKSFLNDPELALGNENFELSYLIEESLKRLRSPRTVFDYDFSYLEGSRTLVNVTKKSGETRKTANTIEASKARETASAKLDRLSENSDSLDTPSTASAIENRKQDTEDKKSRRSTDSKVSTVRSNYEVPSKESPRMAKEIDDIKRSIPRGTLNTIDIAKSFRLGNPLTKSTATSGKVLPATTTKNRFALKKNLNELRKDQIIDKNY